VIETTGMELVDVSLPREKWAEPGAPATSFARDEAATHPIPFAATLPHIDK
jgi:hypothetical protein